MIRLAASFAVLALCSASAFAGTATPPSAPGLTAPPLVLALLAAPKQNERMSPRPQVVLTGSCSNSYERCSAAERCCDGLSCECSSSECQCR